MFSRALLASLALATTFLTHHVNAQVSTSCNPLNTTNCPADPAFGMEYNFVFNESLPLGWDQTVGPVTFDSKNGATFTIAKKGDAPTLRTQFYIFFGRIEVWIKAAPGQGIVTSTMMLSDDLDEIDVEFLGGKPQNVSTNYFGKGILDYQNADLFPVNGGVQADYHNYTTVWTKDALTWYIDGVQVRTLLPNDANNTKTYPQTPMRFSLGAWAGGDSGNEKGVIDWAGGVTDYSKGPYTMYVRSAHITDYSTNSSSYTYGDTSGTYQSIRVEKGNSTAKQTITAPPPLTLAQKWNNLSPTAKIAIYASAAGVGGAFLIWFTYYCIRQRRRGAKQAKLEEAQWQKDQAELNDLKRKGIDPDSFADETPEYHGKEGEVAAAVEGSYFAQDAEVAAAARNARDPSSGLRSPAVPLLQDGRSQSPRLASPGPGTAGMRNLGASSPRGAYADLSNAPASPIRSPAAQQPGGARSFTAPDARMRVASPAQSDLYGNGPQRTYSPSPMQMQPSPQRSFTAGGYGAPPPRPTQSPYGQGRYGGGGNGGNGGDGYWTGQGQQRWT